MYSGAKSSCFLLLHGSATPKFSTISPQPKTHTSEVDPSGFWVCTWMARRNIAAPQNAGRGYRGSHRLTQLGSPT